MHTQFNKQKKAEKRPRIATVKMVDCQFGEGGKKCALWIVTPALEITGVILLKVRNFVLMIGVCSLKSFALLMCTCRISLTVTNPLKW